MAFNRGAVAHLDRRRELAQQIVDRHSHIEQECAWRGYIERLGPMVRYHVKAAGPLPVQLAEQLEPGALDRRMAETRDD